MWVKRHKDEIIEYLYNNKSSYKDLNDKFPYANSIEGMRKAFSRNKDLHNAFKFSKSIGKSSELFVKPRFAKGIVYVYYLPEENYCGITKNPVDRMRAHRYSGKDTDGWTILYASKNMKDACYHEALFQSVLAMEGLNYRDEYAGKQIIKN